MTHEEKKAELTAKRAARDAARATMDAAEVVWRAARAEAVRAAKDSAEYDAIVRPAHAAYMATIEAWQAVR